MAKILNIDSLAPTMEPRVLNIDGVDHEIQEMSVELFIKTTQLAEKMEKEGASIHQKIESTVDLIAALVPTLDKGKLRKFKLGVLSKIAQFVRGETDGDTPAPAAPQEGAAEGK